MHATEESFGIVPLMKTADGWMVLLISHQGSLHWAFPKGHKNEGETDLETAVRELKEETGLEVETLLQDTPFKEQYVYRRKSNLIQKTVSYFPAIVKGEVFLQEEEIRESKWIPLEQAQRNLSFKETRLVCENVMNTLALSLHNS